ncbi:unnamed protein product [Sphenostylis stenocarpa]|uniref:Uncharacterized protein n=1 Tax=Sphenostylis stenocarpa TaxID=92480 RepID=A0AA86SN78_9FABA|nr:unnamed protein product [Sphenostylis stenocarpa]
MVCGYSKTKARARKKGNLEGHDRCLFMGGGQVGYQRMALRSLTGIGTKHVEIRIGLSYSEGNSIARNIVDDGVGRVKGPSDGASKREELSKNVRGKDVGVEEMVVAPCGGATC